MSNTESTDVFLTLSFLDGLPSFFGLPGERFSFGTFTFSRDFPIFGVFSGDLTGLPGDRPGDGLGDLGDFCRGGRPGDRPEDL